MATALRSKRTKKLIIGTVMAGAALGLATVLPANAAVYNSTITRDASSVESAYYAAAAQCANEGGSPSIQYKGRENADGSWSATIACGKQS